MEDGGGARTRAKSPLVNSAERPGKVLKVNISTPLAECPRFPSIITEGGQNDMGGEKGDQGKGGHKGKEGGKGDEMGDEKGYKGIIFFVVMVRSFYENEIPTHRKKTTTKMPARNACLKCLYTNACTKRRLTHARHPTKTHHNRIKAFPLQCLAAADTQEP